MKDRMLILLCVLFGISIAPAAFAAPEAASSASPLYRVKNGTQVDAKTLTGWKAWRSLACDRCHGAEQEGLVGPSLVEWMKSHTEKEFHTALMEGRPDRGMPPFKSSKIAIDNWEGLYAYLKGRSDGRIQPGRLSALDEK